MARSLRSCIDCVHFVEHPCCCIGSDDCGCMGHNECTASAFRSWPFNNHKTHEPDPEGWWTHREDFVVGCTQHNPGTPTLCECRSEESETPMTHTDPTPVTEMPPDEQAEFDHGFNDFNDDERGAHE